MPLELPPERRLQIRLINEIHLEYSCCSTLCQSNKGKKYPVSIYIQSVTQTQFVSPIRAETKKNLNQTNKVCARSFSEKSPFRLVQRLAHAPHPPKYAAAKVFMKLSPHFLAGPHRTVKSGSWEKGNSVADTELKIQTCLEKLYRVHLHFCD